MITYSLKKSWKQTDENISKLQEKGIGLLVDRNTIQTQPYYLCPIIKDGMLGFMNSFAEIIIQPQYKEVSGPFCNENSFVAVRLENDLYEVIDVFGNFVLGTFYKEIYLTGDIAVIRDANLKYAVVNVRTKELLVDFGRYCWIDHGFVGEKYARVIINRTPLTKETLSTLPRYTDISDEKKCYMSRHQSWGVIDCRGNEVVPLIYDYLGCLNINEEGIACVQAQWQYCYTNKDGNEVNMTEYSKPFIIPELTASQSTDSKPLISLEDINISIFMDVDGHMEIMETNTLNNVIRNKFIDLRFEDGISITSIHDANGRTIVKNYWPNREEKLMLISTSKNQKYGLVEIGKNTRELLFTEYEKIIKHNYNKIDIFKSEEEDYWWIVWKDNKWGIYSTIEQSFVLPVSYPVNCYNQSHLINRVTLDCGFFVCKEHIWGDSPKTYLYLYRQDKKLYLEENEHLDLTRSTPLYYFTKYKSFIRKYNYCGTLVSEMKNNDPIGIIKYDNDHDLKSERNDGSWDAMTDGMYGELPEGFDGDFSFIGE